MRIFLISLLSILVAAVLIPVNIFAQSHFTRSPFAGSHCTRLIQDCAGRQVLIDKNVSRIICSGAGCLRLITYLGAQNKVVAVDSIESKGMIIDARPYQLLTQNFLHFRFLVK